ncbi:MAG TPA: TPM domain-containing protein [Cerasibacillus sp.]|uniref:TPM domain-containing protein n=1 Tax=Cerasibacillus sp. TaxID=2498711 RepID=UPI002F42F647
MIKYSPKSTSIFILLFFLILPLTNVFAENKGFIEEKQKIYDDAKLLSAEEIAELESIANEYGEKRDTNLIILTTNDSDGKGFKKYTQDFYDEHLDGPNAAILTIDMGDREVYIAGFYKGEDYLDFDRIDLILDKVQPKLSDGDHYGAMDSFLSTAHKYLGIKPGIDPDFILFKLEAQVVIALGLAGAIVGLMLYNSGGKVTTTARTYMDGHRSRILNKRDVYLRKTVTKRRKPKNNSGGGGSTRGGGGVTSGGHSHSGGSRSF